MKKSLLALSALTVAVSSPAFAVDPYGSYNPYSTQPAANPQYGYVNQQPAAGYPQQYAQAAQPQQYNNYQPASGNANDSKWPFWYVGLNAGVAFAGADDWERGAAGGSLDNDDALALSATLGYKPSNFRYELELGYAEHSIGAGASTGDVQATKLIGSVLYDFQMAGFSPFLGAGLGAVKADLSPTNTAGVDGYDTKLAYQLTGGVSINNVLPQTDLSLAYKYLDTFKDFKENGADFEYSAHTVEAGARFRF